MDPIEILKEEHRVIERMLKIISIAAERLQRGDDIRIKVFEEIVDFIKVFADRCHHGKEEDILYPAFKERGIPSEGGPIGVMLQEHELGRSFVRGLADAIARFKAGDESARSAIADNALKYVELLSQHIPKEDEILYPMGNFTLSNHDRTALVEQFEEVERERIGEGVHQRYHQLVENLEREVGISG